MRSSCNIRFLLLFVVLPCSVCGQHVQETLLNSHAACAAHLDQCSEALASQGGDQEDAAFGVLQAWLMELYTRDPDKPKPSLSDDRGMRQNVLSQLLHLAKIAVSKPALALGVGHVLHSFFWWGGAECLEGAWHPGPSVVIAKEALKLQELAVRNAGCFDKAMNREHFLAKRCPWRWRHLFLIGTQLGHHLALTLRDLSSASTVFRQLSSHLEVVRSLPFFNDHDTTSAISLNQNRDFFPRALHWPVWPRSKWPGFGHFLEDNFVTFKQALLDLLTADPAGNLFRMASAHQSEMAPRYDDWSRMNLVNSLGPSEFCKMVPALRPACELLAKRPEINEQCETYLAGAAFARLSPGTELKPHFDTNGRLAAHLGLSTPSGATMTVGGETVVWEEGKAIVFDDTYVHNVQHFGHEPRYLLIAWFCHPCDLAWRESLGSHWMRLNPLPDACGVDRANGQ